ncbi:MAG TPA: hypothetical protein VN193_04595 [Candidatus Angelobacter sp.]|jgi:hypothetical protein|nr:hypothetical protein [Candidatus Angelobacter sp.]
MGGLLRSRTGVAIAAAIASLGLTLGTAVAVAHFRDTTAIPAAAVPGVLQTPVPGPCVTKAQAQQVWNDVNARLDALVLHPSLNAVDGVAQGSAAAQIRAYLQQHLFDQHLTELERSRLDDLTVVQAGCGSQPLTVRISETLLQDDYLTADGSVDHADPGVGQASHLVQSYVRAGATWKLVTIASLDPSPGGGITV